MAAKDYNKYVYWTIAIEKGSPAHQGVLEDAKQVKSKQLPTVAALALQNYYKGLAPASAMNQARQAHRQETPESLTVVTTTQEKIDDNLNEAADAW